MVKTKVLFVTALILFAACWWLGLRPPKSEPPPARSDARPARHSRAPTAHTEEGPLSLQVQLDRARMDVPAGSVNALVTLKAIGQRTGPLALTLVLDRSGSMGGLPIEKAREAARQVVRQLRDGDRLAIVSYAGDVSVEMPLTPIGPRRNAFIRALDQVMDGGGTDLAAGLQAGIDQALRADPSMLRHVLVLSDGDSNQGMRGTEPLVELARRAHERGISVSAVRLGPSDFEGRLAQVAEAGGGRIWATEPLGLPQAFSSDLEAYGRGLTASDVHVELTPFGAKIVDSSCPERAPDVAPGQVYQCRIRFAQDPRSGASRDQEFLFAKLTYEHGGRRYTDVVSLNDRHSRQRPVTHAHVSARCRALDGRTDWLQVDGATMFRTEAH